MLNGYTGGVESIITVLIIQYYDAWSKNDHKTNGKNYINSKNLNLSADKSPHI